MQSKDDRVIFDCVAALLAAAMLASVQRHKRVTRQGGNIETYTTVKFSCAINHIVEDFSKFWCNQLLESPHNAET